jgi:3-oxoacyl-[acyl-carrier protein] reductase
LINNSGGPPPGLFHEKDDDDWVTALNLNLLSAIRFSKLIYPIMAKNSYGRIINILSLLAKEPTPNMVLSSTSRAGLIAFAKSVSHDLGPLGITINNICPGGVLTDRLKSLLETGASSLNIDYEEHFNNRVSTVPLGRFANPEEIGDLVAFLVSEKAGFITGTSIIADGGQGKGIH